ncbi:hypothetical protein ACFY8W_24025 [Streptomyces sp. NPDC012637]|uniref:hypothetical protein n=1 Tax=Streptomyces sp. NPDC012637 TaxID=3364842 RepID=UPI0036E55AB1
MSITSPLPVLHGDQDTELRGDGEALTLRRPDEELRIPFAAIARVRAEKRRVAVELTAPAGAAPTEYRVEDVSAAAAVIFADAVNAALPARAAGDEAVDGATLVVTRSLRVAVDETELPDDDATPAAYIRGGFGAAALVALLAALVWPVGEDPSRAIATLLVGMPGVAIATYAAPGIPMVWRRWYLPRHGVTVAGRHVYRHGTTTNAYVATDGVTRYVRGSNGGRSIQVAYDPRNPERAVVRRPEWVRDEVRPLTFFLVVAALFLGGACLLALPAFQG